MRKNSVASVLRHLRRAVSVTSGLHSLARPAHTPGHGKTRERAQVLIIIVSCTWNLDLHIRTQHWSHLLQSHSTTLYVACMDCAAKSIFAYILHVSLNRLRSHSPRPQRQRLYPHYRWLDVSPKCHHSDQNAEHVDNVVPICRDVTYASALYASMLFTFKCT